MGRKGATSHVTEREATFRNEQGGRTAIAPQPGAGGGDPLSLTVVKFHLRGYGKASAYRQIVRRFKRRGPERKRKARFPPLSSPGLYFRQLGQGNVGRSKKYRVFQVYQHRDQPRELSLARIYVGYARRRRWLPTLTAPGGSLPGVMPTGCGTGLGEGT